MPVERFIARQPILDAKLNVVAYELLFRSDLDNYCKAVDSTQASSTVISDSVLLFDLAQLTAGKGAFVNMGRAGLLAEHARVLPPELTTIEILEDVAPEDDVLEACRRLKAAGYRLALDDYVGEPGSEPFIDLVDCVKVDMLATSQQDVRALVPKLQRRGLTLLAEKVETQADFDAAVLLGFTLFQGYFFARPAILSSRDVPGFKATYLHLLREINKDPFDLNRVENIIRQDVSISYKYLRYINSAAMGLRSRVSSLREALVLMGQRNIRTLGSLWALAGLGQDKPVELIEVSVIRARFCENLAPLAGFRGHEDEAFLLGLLSLIDVIVGRPMDAVAAELPLSEDVRLALVEGCGPLRPLLECIVAYEQGNWQSVTAHAAALGVDEATVPQLYLDAIPTMQKERNA